MPTTADVFADRCANCHGPAGQGDGEMAGQLELPPRDFTQPDFRQTAVPQICLPRLQTAV